MSAVARRYAKALFALAKEAATVSPTAAELSQVAAFAAEPPGAVIGDRRFRRRQLQRANEPAAGSQAFVHSDKSLVERADITQHVGCQNHAPALSGFGEQRHHVGFTQFSVDLLFRRARQHMRR